LKNLSQNCLTTAYWCRDQNFRKYFEARKRHGIAPSINVSGFYNRHKCEAYYNGKLEAEFLMNKVEKVTG
jgi:hypothetical protein